jgi:hypothetical protein
VLLRDKEKSKIRDFALLAATATITAAAGVAIVLVALWLKLSQASLFVAMATAVAMAIVAWDYRARLREPAFLAFLSAWAVVHAVVLLALRISWSAWATCAFVELTVGYSLMFWLFGDHRSPNDSSK